MSDDTSPSERPDRAGEPDDRLIAAVAERRDRDAFVVLFERYAGRVKGFLMRAGEPEGAAEEIAQEVMIAVWRKAGRFDGAKASAATWIFTIARNRRIDRLRRAGAGGEAPEPDIDPEPAASAETGLAGADRDARVRAAVAGLTAEQREVVRLAYFSGLSQSEIATRLDLPLGTVKSRLRLAFARLRDALGPDFVQELRDD